jgi:transmembrane sensor
MTRRPRIGPATEDSGPPETVERAAARWLARRRSGEMTGVETARLEAWLDSDPAHRLAYDVVSRAWASVGLMRSEPEVLTLRARYRRSRSGLRRLLVPLALAAACLVVATSAGLWALDAGLLASRHFSNQTFRTAVGDRQTILLPDGSQVTLNTDTVLRTRASARQRLLFLDRGQAYFKVAKDASRPFIVTSGDRTVTAVGTAFEVRVDKGRFEVTLVEGRVKVGAPIAPAPTDPLARRRIQTSELVAGSRFVALDDRRWSVDRADAVKETAWVTGWLRFDDDRLDRVAAELARYSERRIVLDDPALASAPISGRFRPDDLDAFVRALATYGIATVSVENNTEIHLIASSEKKTSGTM